MRPAGRTSVKRARTRIDCRSGKASGADHAAPCSAGPIRGNVQPIAEQCADRIALGLERIRLQQLFGRLHVQVVGDVERMHDDADVDRAGFWMYIDVGKRNRMGVRLAGMFR